MDENLNAVVCNDGSVLWIPPRRLTLTCPHYEGEYHCIFKVGSWTYDGFRLDVELYEGLESIDVSDYILSNEHRIEYNTATKNVKYYPCCEEPYPDLKFTLVLKLT